MRINNFLNNEINKNNIEKESNLNINNEIKNKFINEKSKTFFNKVANSAVDLGIRMVCPDLLEDVVISLKNNIIENGFKDGFKNVKNEMKDIYNVIFKGKRNLNFGKEINMLINSNGILTGFSKMLTNGINISVKKGLVSKNIGQIIKKGKTTVINTFKDQLYNSATKEIEKLDNLQNYVNNWKKALDTNDIKRLEKEYKNIENITSYNKEYEKLFSEIEKIKKIQNYFREKDYKNFSKENIEILKKID